MNAVTNVPSVTTVAMTPLDHDEKQLGAEDRGREDVEREVQDLLVRQAVGERLAPEEPDSGQVRDREDDAVGGEVEAPDVNEPRKNGLAPRRRIGPGLVRLLVAKHVEEEQPDTDADRGVREVEGGPGVPGAGAKSVGSGRHRGPGGQRRFSLA